MKISKATGATFVFAIPLQIYTYFFRGFVHGNPYFVELNLTFLLGFFFLFFRVLKEDTELMFFGKGTGYYWGEGFCFDPSLVPFLSEIGIFIPWGLRPPRSAGINRLAEKVNIHHYQDQREMRYNVNVETSFFAATMHRIASNFIGWFFGFKKGEEHLIYRRIGIRIILVAVVAGFMTNKINDIKNTSFIPDILGNGTTTVLVQLNKTNRQYLIPSNEMFTPLPYEKDSQYYTYVDGIKYFRFQRGKGYGILPIIKISDSSCAIVPAGRELDIFTTRRPVYAMNMEVELTRYIDRKYAQSLEQFKVFIKESFSNGRYSIPRHHDWVETYDDWEHSEFNNGTTAILTVKAKDQEKIPGNTPGGLVCF